MPYFASSIGDAPGIENSWRAKIWIVVDMERAYWQRDYRHLL
jgi:hypothetical protein